MSRRQLLISVFALAGCSLSGCAYVPAAGPTPHDLAAYQWLLGDWRAQAGENYVRERWAIHDQRSFAGVGSNENRTSGELSGFEHLQLAARDGKVFYIAAVKHNPAPVAFELVNNDPHHLVFSNPEHDFPKQIVYLRVDQNHFRVEVSDGGDQGFALDFERMKEDPAGVTPGN